MNFFNFFPKFTGFLGICGKGVFGDWVRMASRFIGDYEVGEQIGAGSFSVVWHGWHKVDGTEVAIKEIVTERLSKKLQESLMYEIVILKQIDHPNIIRLHDIIKVSVYVCNNNICVCS